MNLNETREFFKADRFAVEAAGAVIEDAREGFSRCSLELKPVHRNAAGAVMGGAILRWRILLLLWRQTAAAERLLFL